VPEPTRFSLIIGGPFHASLGRLGLLAADGLPRNAAALVLISIAWGLPALLIVLQSLVDPGYQGGGFLVDPRAHTRWGIAMAVMILYERVADARFLAMGRMFRESGLIGDAAQAGYHAALMVADRRTSSKLTEALILILAYIFSQDTVELRWMTPGSAWAGTFHDGHVTLSWAGLAVTYFSDPLFVFLFLRWLWRFVVLAIMLRNISRLPLRLVATHPDGIGGLGFLGRFSTAVVGLVFALSSVIAAGFYVQTQTGEYATAAIGGWVALMLAVFLGPLIVLVGPLNRFRSQMQRAYAGLAVRHHVEFHRTWIEGRSTESPVSSTDMSTAADLNATVERVYAMRIVPIDRYAVAPVAIAALLPMLPVISANAQLFSALKTLVGFLI
jgi:hypothetical protein